MKEFYNLLQQSEAVLKNKVKESETVSGRCYYIFALVARAFCIVAFAVLFVSLSTTFFGSENSAMGVVLLVVLMTVRFVPFGYCIKDTLVTFAAFLAVMTFGPSLALVVPSWAVVFVHFISLLIVICITTQNPRMGLGGLVGFAYIYLTGNSVLGDSLVSRAELAVAGYIIIALILVYKHRDKNKDVRFIQLLKKFSFTNPISLWQIRLALGLAIVLTIGQLVDIPRFMWIGFACSTVLTRFPIDQDPKQRFSERVEGIALGSVGFVFVCILVPESMYSLIGLIGGFVLAFCTTYCCKTTVICFGALSVAEELYGVGGAAFLRIINNVTGAVFAYIFTHIFDRLITRNLIKEKPAGQPESGN